MHDVFCRLAVRDDIPRLVELFNAQYARKKDETYFVWQFFESAWPAVMMCAEFDGQVEGVFGLQKRMLSDGTHIGQAIDLLITPQLRGKGIFAELGRLAAAHFPDLRALCVLPNMNGRNACVKSLKNCVQLGEMVTYICDTRPQNFDPNIIDTLAVSRFDRWVDEVVTAFQRMHPQLTSVKREVHYLNWRFTENPTYHYNLFQVLYGRQVFGYLVLKVFKDPTTGQITGDIVDILWAEDNADRLSEMLRFALAYFHDQGVPQSAIWLQTNTILDEVGSEVGFVKTNQKRSFCCKVLDERYAWLKDSKVWFVTLSDSEVY
jgi:hypothetical protein